MLRLVEAIVRLELLEEVVKALKRANVPRMTISHVRAVGSGCDPEQTRLSLELGTGYTEKALIQCVCPQDQVNEVVGEILEHAHTGCPGDGVVFVMPVERAVKIRTGAEGVEAIA